MSLAAKNSVNVARPVLRYHGAKWKIAPWIIRNMPAHSVYVEPFGGGGSVLLRKERLPAEIYNDLDGRVVKVFRCLQDPVTAEAVRRRLSLTPFSRAEYERCYEVATDDVDGVCKTIALSFFGFGSDSITRSCRSGFRGKMLDKKATPAQAWSTYSDLIDTFTRRLMGVVIENRDANLVMQNYDTLDTLHFVDPPYVHVTRSRHRGKNSTTHGYKHEMSDEDHRSLAGVLHGLTGLVLLSGYASSLYDELYPDWQRLELKTMADGAKKRTECLWFNPAAWSRRPQMELMAREVCA